MAFRGDDDGGDDVTDIAVLRGELFGCDVG
jgi:hypothetical protein